MTCRIAACSIERPTLFIKARFQEASQSGRQSILVPFSRLIVWFSWFDPGDITRFWWPQTFQHCGERTSFW